MKPVLVDMLLGVAVLSAWLASLAFLRLRTALDRLHCASFVNIATGIAVTLAVFVEDGLSSRASKTLALLAILIISGAATIHAAGRTLLVRDETSR